MDQSRPTRKRSLVLSVSRERRPNRPVACPGLGRDFGYENRWWMPCGYIAYEAEADPEKTAICHCTDCQRLSGSAFRTVVRVAGETFKIVSGQLTIYVKTAESGAKRVQGFCPRCGSPIYSTAEGDEPKFYSIRVGTVRQRVALVPKLQIWSCSQRHWVTDLASIPTMETQ
ncbi:MAG: GFA family protein [Xanthobacteraceae bacterium]